MFALEPAIWFTQRRKVRKNFIIRIRPELGLTEIDFINTLALAFEKMMTPC